MLEEKIEIKTTAPNLNEMKKELKDELNFIDREEQTTKPQVEKKSIPIPSEVVSGYLRLEGAVICAILTKNSSNHVKELARKTLEPTATEIQVTKDFAQAIFDKYAPRVFESEDAGLYMLGLAYLLSTGQRVGSIYALTQADHVTKKSE